MFSGASALAPRCASKSTARFYHGRHPPSPQPRLALGDNFLHVQSMCEVKSSPTSGCGVIVRYPSPAWENGATEDAASGCYLRALPRYRVLRWPSRGGGRSVDRDRVGRNASSVKGIEPRQTTRSVVAEQVWSRPEHWSREGRTGRKAGTTGVQDHSMHGGPTTEHVRSAQGRAEAQRPWPQTSRQGLRPKSAVIPRAEVRCLHCSVEAGQRPWSEGRHGE